MKTHRLALGVLALAALAFVGGNAIGETVRVQDDERVPTARISEGSGIASLLETSRSEVVGLKGSLGMGFAPMTMRPVDLSGDATESLATSRFEAAQSNPALELAAPSTFAFGPVAPNPFERSTVLSFDLPKTSRVRITTFDVRGREVMAARSEELGPGRYQRRWNGVDGSSRALSPGIYLIRIEASAVDGGAGLNAVRKVLMLR